MFPRVALAALVLSAVPLLGGCGGSNGLFSALNTPTITGISPNPATPGSAITITGTNLNGTSTTVYYLLATGALYNGSASSGSTTSVVATVPSTVPAGSYSIYVQTTDSAGDISTASNSVSISIN